MEKMFKRSLLGAAVAVAAISGSANAAIELAGENVVFYGQAAGGIVMSNPDASGSDSSVIADIESRIGFRGRVQFDAISPDFIWQIEGGNTDNVWQNGHLGGRDTYLGFDFDGVGSIKYGRQLVAAFNYIDWPHTNPGLGNVFDVWNADANDHGASFEDRANNVIRFDSANFGGFNFQATLSGMGSTTDAMVASLGTSYSTDLFSVHAGYYNQDKYTVAVAATEDAYEFDTETGQPKLVPGKAATTEDKGDASYYIVGGSVFLGDVTLTAAYKESTNGLTNVDQGSYSATAQYVIDGTYVLKAGYAGTENIATDGGDNGDQAITGRLGYLLPSAYLYLDVRNYDYNGSDDTKDGTNIHLGAEYYF
ncbi:porin [Enterovibrio norvegicus]|uniref:Porin n=1 Tax=Enterovibrio norvegicus TaxID=188144 RepID=A0ABV4L517_9GAMM|nr:porin [Enterovibrio norvegicus]OEF58917.1 hypothetical protein A1OU_12250 [Enterovibrio norvegicus]